jgi:hypothetical protein
MLMIANLDWVACALVGLTSLLSIVALWFRPGAWWASIGVLATGVGVMFFAPFTLAFQMATSDFAGCGVPGEFLLLGGFVVLLHLLAFGTVALLAVEKILEHRRAGRRDS